MIIWIRIKFYEIYTYNLSKEIKKLIEDAEIKTVYHPY